MTDDSRQIDDIFAAAIDIASRDERDGFVESACGDNHELLSRVQKLLASHDRADGFLEAAAPGLTNLSQRIARERTFDLAPGSTIDGYRIITQIGEGGSGTAFLAEQNEPVKRSVALKVIKLGMDTQQVIHRFEAERQALALMNHPNIARVYDAGTTAFGRPYFVMEFVDGVAISEYCDGNRLDIRARLLLFVQVCQAVHHAHQKGLIHRDIKPGNVLVSTVDDQPVAKVIDFGIAKATGAAAAAAEKTQFTQSSQLIGTIEYMSPEQAEGSLDIDIRTDVYSLGVVLYELLTGRTPFDGADLRSKAYGEMQRIICETEPERPSTQISQRAAGVEDRSLVFAARSRATEVRGELDWIVMKCIEKDRGRRYESAAALAADIHHHLLNEPVSAAAPSRIYKARKFVQRNKGAVVAVSCIALLLVGGVISTTWGLIGERRARRHATAAAAAEKLARETASARENESRAVLDFVEQRVLAAARPQGQEGGLGHDVTLRKAVEAALPAVESSFKDQPLVETRLRRTMGLSFWYLGDSKTAAEQFEAALALSVKHNGPDHPDTLVSMSNLATQYSSIGRIAEATDLRERTLKLQRAKLGPEHRATLATMNNLANSYDDQGRQSEAIALWEEALPLMRRALGGDDKLTIIGMTNLAAGYQNIGRQADALRLSEETLAIVRRKFGPDYAGAIPIMNGLGTSYDEAGRDDEALKLREETLTLAKAKLGPDHPMTLWAMNNLAISYAAVDRHSEALALREEVLARRRSLFGDDHPDTLDAMHNLASSYGALGRHGEALALRERVLSIRRTKLGEDHPDTLRSMHNLAATYDALGRDMEALNLREETYARRRSKLGIDHPDTLKSQSHLAQSLLKLNRASEALALIDDCIDRAGRLEVDRSFVEQLQATRAAAASAAGQGTTKPTAR